MEPPTQVDYVDSQSRKSYEKVGRVYNAIKEKMGIKIIEGLLQIEGDINYEIPKHYGVGPNLLFSSYSVEPAMLSLLLEAGADFTRKNDEGRTVVHERIRVEKIKLMRVRGIYKNDFVDTILYAHKIFNNPENPCDGNEISHLHVASVTNNASAVEYFLDNGVNVNQAVSADSPIFPLNTPLHLAMKYACSEVVKILLQYRANTILKNADGMTPLHLLVEIYTEEWTSVDLPQYDKTLDIFLKFLFSDLTDVNSNDDFGFCKFHVACLLQDQSMVKSVLEQVADINQPVNSDSPVCPGFTAFHFAAFSNVQIFKLLLEMGADIEVKNARGESPFDLCLKKYNLLDIRAVLSAKQDWKNILLSDNKTKLIDVVSAMENPDEFSSFLDDITSASTLYVPHDSPLWAGYTLLHLAVVFTKEVSLFEHIHHRKRHDNSKIDVCLKQRVDITAADANGSTALHLAFYTEKLCVVGYLLDHHDNANNPIDRDNLSHFHIACAAGHVKTVEHFLSNGVDVNSPVHSTFKWHVCSLNIVGYPQGYFYICPGSTALHINAASCGVQVTKQLLKHGADVHAQDVNGFTPIHRLLSPRINNHYDDHSNVLLSVKNLKDIVTPCGLSHLHVACLCNNSKSIKKLLKRGADVNAPLTYRYTESFEDRGRCKNDEYGNPFKPLAFLSKYTGYTPLHFLHEIFSDSDTISVLMERGADIFAKNGDGFSALQSMLKPDNLHYRPDFNYKQFNKNPAVQTYLEEEYGITRLHIACLIDDLSLVKKLINNGANVNAKVYSNSPVLQGYTSLHCVFKKIFEKCNKKSVVARLEKIVRLLIKKGADLFLIDSSCNTPFHLIELKQYNFRDALYFISIFFENVKNFNINSTNTRGLSLFHIACRTGNLVTIEKFLYHGVDVNQAISHFSDWHPGSTPLHLLLQYYPRLEGSTSKWDFNDKTFLKIIDMFLEKGADVNATDAFSETPLFKVIIFRGVTELKSNEIRLSKLRRLLTEKFIKHGANVHVTNVKGVTPFELQLTYDDTSWEEIELFFEAGSHLDTYNPISHEGYIARIFRFQRTYFPPRDKIMENKVWLNIIYSTSIIKINHRGRTAIHNVVSIHADDERERSSSMHPYYSETTYTEFHAELIELLSVRGCDIDHQDIEGKTALHLAADFKNNRAIRGLLDNGADINLTDENGKTAFTLCFPSMTTFIYPEDIDARIAIDYDENFAVKAFAVHVLKLEFCGILVNNQNKQLKIDVQRVHPLANNALDLFRNEIEKTKSMAVGTKFFSLHDLLMNPDADIVYMNMTSEERQDVNQFFETVGKFNFLEIGGLLKLKYRQTIERIKLVEPALKSLNLLIRYQLPDLCCRNILNFLKNEDLKRLIASAIN